MSLTQCVMYAICMCILITIGEPWMLTSLACPEKVFAIVGNTRQSTDIFLTRCHAASLPLCLFMAHILIEVNLKIRFKTFDRTVHLQEA